MHYNEFQNQSIDTNECTSRGACSVSPNIFLLQELVVFFLQQISYYVLKLEELGAINKSIKFEIINDIAALVSINEFNEEQLYSMIMKEYFLLENTKDAYIKLSSKKKVKAKLLKKTVNISDSTPISKAIAAGEKLFLSRYKKLSIVQKNLVDILEIVIKSCSSNIVNLSEISTFDDKTYHQVLEALNLLNKENLNEKDLKSYISNLAKSDFDLQKKICSSLLDKFGKIENTEVSYSTRKGKAILVSGNNFENLYKILEDTKDKNVDVYTHANLLLSHALSKFKKFEHLIGHYGDKTESSILDFSTFPGAILLTKSAKKNSEYLYRGRLFSNDYVVSKGVIKIENNNYEPLIESALSSKGFARGKTKPSSFVGFDENYVENRFSEIIDKLNSNEIKRLFIIGINPYSELQRLYFKTLLSRMNKDEFALNFSGITTDSDNILSVNIGNFSPLAIDLLGKFFKNYQIDNQNIYFFFPTCDALTISNIITLNSMEAKNIYMADCSPTLLNPSIFTTFRKIYNVNLTEDAFRDLDKIRKK